MDEKQKTITTTGLIEFCKIKYARLDVWMKRNILMFDNPLPGAGHTRQFGFDDVVVAKVVTDLMRMTGNFEIARKAVELLREQPRYGEAFDIIVSSKTTIEDGEIKHEYNIGWGSFPRTEEKGTDIFFYGIGQEELDRAIIFVPISEIMKEVEKFFAGLETKEKQAV